MSERRWREDFNFAFLLSRPTPKISSFVEVVVVSNGDDVFFCVTRQCFKKTDLPYLGEISFDDDPVLDTVTVDG